MPHRIKRIARLSAGILAAGVLLTASPAQAGLFERLFGGFGHGFHAPRLPDAIREFAPPSDRPERIDPRDIDTGPRTAFCVRSCDGHYFPVISHPGFSAAEACHAFCPASKTQLFTGGKIDDAVASDGKRYADMPNAFAYRQHLVAGCTCNGHDAFGLAHIDAAHDPTLKPGDVVATKNGMQAFTGREGKEARFTPAQTYARFSRQYRAQLSSMDIRSAQR